MKKHLLSIIAFIVICVLLIGCGGGGGGGGGGASAPSEQSEFIYSTVANSKGTFWLSSSKSGTVVESSEEGTLASGTSVVLVERLPKSNESKLFGGNSSNIYTLKAKNGNKTIVNLEKPIIVTIPNNFGKEYKRFFLGSRSETANDWQYIEILDNNDVTPNIAYSSRLAVKESKNFRFKIFRVSYSYAIFAIKGGSDLDKKLDSVKVIQFSSNPSNLYFDKSSKYITDIKVSSCITANKSSALFDGSEVTSQLVFFNSNSADLSGLKTDGANAVQTSSTTKDSSNNQYSHTLYIKSYKKNNIAISGNNATYTFEFKLSGVSTKDFPDSFRVKTVLKNANGTEFASEGSVKLKKEKEPEKVDTNTNTKTSTNTSTGTSTNTKTSTDTNTNTKTSTGTTTNTKTNTSTDTGSGTSTNTSTSTETGSGTATQTNTATGSATSTNTSTNTGSSTSTQTQTSTNTQTTTNTNTSTGTSTSTGTNTSVEVYEIRYELNDGQLTKANPEKYDVGSATFTLNNPTKNGYTFKGWSGTGLNGDSNKTVTISKGSTGNRNYTANWSINSYMLTLNKGTGISGVTGNGLHVYGSAVNVSCTMKAGYEFDSWSGDFTSDTFNMPANNATMTANARVINYSISCNLGDGNVAISNPTTYNVTSSDITLNNPSKDYYNFKGWTGSNGEVPQTTVKIPQNSTGNKTYTANYTPISYSINYDLAGGSLGEGVTNPTTYDITSATITINNPTREHYSFQGWTGTGIPANTPSMSLTIPQGSHDNRSYTANWAHVNPYTGNDNDISTFYDEMQTISIEGKNGDERESVITVTFISSVDSDYYESIFYKLFNDTNDSMNAATFTYVWSENNTKLEVIPKSSLTIEKPYFYYNNSAEKTYYVPLNIFNGEGTEGNPYKIYTAAQLDAVRLGLDKCYDLMNDINISTNVYQSPTNTTTAGWTPIGVFDGIFNGNGYIIKNLKINLPEASGVGFFSSTSDNSVIKNMVLGGQVIGQSNVGGIVAYSRSALIYNCYNKCSVRGISNVGGIVGQSTAGEIKNCTNSGSLYGSTVGGISSSGTVKNCKNTGNISFSGYQFARVGGIIASGNAEECYNSGSISYEVTHQIGFTNGEDHLGGIAASGSTVKNCYSNSLPSISYYQYLSTRWGRKAQIGGTGVLCINCYARNSILGVAGGTYDPAKGSVDCFILSEGPCCYYYSGTCSRCRKLSTGYKAEIENSFSEDTDWRNPSIWTLNENAAPTLTNCGYHAP